MPTHTLTLRLNDAQYRMIEALEERLLIDKTNVLRFALARLAESEGIIAPPEFPKPSNRHL